MKVITWKRSVRLVLAIVLILAALSIFDFVASATADGAKGVEAFNRTASSSVIEPDI